MTPYNRPPDPSTIGIIAISVVICLFDLFAICFTISTLHSFHWWTIPTLLTEALVAVFFGGLIWLGLKEF